MPFLTQQQLARLFNVPAERIARLVDIGGLSDSSRIGWDSESREVRKTFQHFVGRELTREDVEDCLADPAELAKKQRKSQVGEKQRLQAQLQEAEQESQRLGELAGRTQRTADIVRWRNAKREVATIRKQLEN